MVTLFLILSLLLLLSALAVVALRNPLHCALALLLNLLSVAALYATLHAHFLMAAQIIVYAGAIVVLLIFVIMLLNIRAETGRRRNYFQLVLGIVAAAFFIAVSIPVLRDSFYVFEEGGVAIEGSVRDVGRLLYSQYYFIFQVSGILLLAAAIGAVMIARKSRGLPEKEADDASQ